MHSPPRDGCWKTNPSLLLYCDALAMSLATRVATFSTSISSAPKPFPPQQLPPQSTMPPPLQAAPNSMMIQAITAKCHAHSMQSSACITLAFCRAPPLPTKANENFGTCYSKTLIRTYTITMSTIIAALPPHLQANTPNLSHFQATTLIWQGFLPDSCYFWLERMPSHCAFSTWCGVLTTMGELPLMGQGETCH